MTENKRARESRDSTAWDGTLTNTSKLMASQKDKAAASLLLYRKNGPKTAVFRKEHGEWINKTR